MAAPGRTYNADNYRYGFNGQEKENELLGQGNTISYENRFYDSRIGRWFSSDKVELVGWSSYGFCVNNPIRHFDDKGNVQRDPNGNIIFTPVKYKNSTIFGLFTQETVRKMLVKNEENSHKNALVIEGYIYTDKGTPIKVYKVLGYYETENTYVTDKDGYKVNVYYETFIDANSNEGKGVRSNCYGDCVADGNFFIPDLSDFAKIIEDEYKIVGSGDISNKKFQVGDVIKIGEDHFIKAESIDKEGNIIWSSDFSTDKKETGTLKQIVKSLQDGQYGNAGEKQKFSLKKATLFRQQNPSSPNNPTNQPRVNRLLINPEVIKEDDTPPPRDKPKENDNK